MNAVFRRSSPWLVATLQAMVPFSRTHYYVLTRDGGRRGIGRGASLVPLLGAEVRF